MVGRGAGSVGAWTTSFSPWRSWGCFSWPPRPGVTPATRWARWERKRTASGNHGGDQRVALAVRTDQLAERPADALDGALVDPEERRAQTMLCLVGAVYFAFRSRW